MRVNNDVTLGLTIGHWSRQVWPQCDIIIDPHYHRASYFRQVKHTSTKRGFLPFVYLGIQTSVHVHSTTASVVLYHPYMYTTRRSIILDNFQELWEIVELY